MCRANFLQGSVVRRGEILGADQKGVSGTYLVRLGGLKRQGNILQILGRFSLHSVTSGYWCGLLEMGGSYEEWNGNALGERRLLVPILRFVVRQET